MIWRALVAFSVLTVSAYVYGHYGREAAWAASSALTALVLPLAKIEERLAEIVKEIKS